MLLFTHQTHASHNLPSLSLDDVMMEKANQFYREKQYAQHHHLHSNETSPVIAATTSPHHHTIDTLSSWDKYQATLNSMSMSKYPNVEPEDTTSSSDDNKKKLQIMKNLLTWEDYKQLATELQMKKEECTKLHEEVKSLKQILQVERSVHHYDPQVVSSIVVDKEVDDELELKILEDKAKEYDETIEELKSNDDSVRWQ